MKITKTLILVAVLAAGLGCGYSKKTTPPAPGTMPTITQLSPASATAGGAAFQLEVDGTNFATAAVYRDQSWYSRWHIRWRHAARNFGTDEFYDQLGPRTASAGSPEAPACCLSARLPARSETMLENSVKSSDHFRRAFARGRPDRPVPVGQGVGVIGQHSTRQAG